MKYLKIFTDFKKNIQRLTDEECGRLFRAMLEYAETGDEQPLEGREDIVWPIAQEQIDNCREAYESKAGAARRLTAGKGDDAETHDNVTISHDNVTISERHRDDNDDKEQRTKNKEQGTRNNEGTETRAREGALDRRFATFWAAYPKKVGKADAMKAFTRLKVGDALLDTMLTAIQQQRASPQWQKDGGQYIPNPATWLRQGRWEDETQAEIQASPPRANPRAEAWLRIAERMEAQA